MSRGVGPIPKWGVCNALGPLKGPLGYSGYREVYPTRSAQALWRCGIGAARVSWSAGEGAGGAAAARTASDDPSIPPFFMAGL